MINNQIIKGEYIFDITIYTMFETYRISTKNHNLITNDGIRFFLNKWIDVPEITYDDETENYKLSNSFEYIRFIGVGTSNETPSVEDDRLKGMTIAFQDTSIEQKGNSIILTVETDGPSLDDTCEIGVYTNNMTLLSRDVHTPYSLPSTSSIELTYTLTLNSTDVSELEEEEEYDD